jgi:hypothetical protein
MDFSLHFLFARGFSEVTGVKEIKHENIRREGNTDAT